MLSFITRKRDLWYVWQQILSDLGYTGGLDKFGEFKINKIEREAFKKIQQDVADGKFTISAITNFIDRDLDNLTYCHPDKTRREFSAAIRKAQHIWLQNDFPQATFARITKDGKVTYVPARPVNMNFFDYCNAAGEPLTHVDTYFSSIGLCPDGVYRSIHNPFLFKMKNQLETMFQLRVCTTLREIGIPMQLNEHGFATAKAIQPEHDRQILHRETTKRARNLDERQAAQGIDPNDYRARKRDNYKDRGKAAEHRETIPPPAPMVVPVQQQAKAEQTAAGKKAQENAKATQNTTSRTTYEHKTEERVQQDVNDIRMKFGLKKLFTDIHQAVQEYATTRDYTNVLMTCAHERAKLTGYFNLAQLSEDAATTLEMRGKAFDQKALDKSIANLMINKPDWLVRQSPVLFTTRAEQDRHERTGQSLNRHIKHDVPHVGGGLQELLRRKYHDPQTGQTDPTIEKLLTLAKPLLSNKSVSHLEQTPHTGAMLALARELWQEGQGRRVIGVASSPKQAELLSKQAGITHVYTPEELTMLTTPPGMWTKFFIKKGIDYSHNAIDAPIAISRVLWDAIWKAYKDNRPALQLQREDVIVLSAANEIAVGRTEKVQDRIERAGSKQVILDKPSSWAENIPSASNCEWKREQMYQTQSQSQSQSQKRKRNHEQGHER